MPTNKITVNSCKPEYFGDYVSDFITRKLGFHVPLISQLLILNSKTTINPSNFNLLQDEINKIREAFLNHE
jgi:hypothetical protein